LSRRQERARELRARIGEHRDGSIVCSREDLVETLGGPAADDGGSSDAGEPARFAQAVLTQHGITSEPRLVDAPAGAPTRLRLTRAYAVQGSLVVALLATVAGLYGWWVYGLILAGATGVGCVIVAARFPWLDTTMPRVVPRGRLLGALVAAASGLVIGLATILPIRASREDEGRRSAAAGLIHQVYLSLERADTDAAQRLFNQAAAADPNAAGLHDARARLTVAHVQELLEEHARREGVFDEAERAFRARRLGRAIRLMSSIRGFRNADQRLAAYRSALRRARARRVR
jgi:hypothetical protein